MALDGAKPCGKRYFVDAERMATLRANIIRRLQEEEDRQLRQKSNSNTPLLKLSAELRNKIFALALPDDEYLAIDDMDNQSFRYYCDDEGVDPPVKIRKMSTRRTYRKAFGITQVCRQTRSDTLKLAYASNNFVCHVNKYLHYTKKWVETRPREALPFITKLVLIAGVCAKENNPYPSCVVTMNLKSELHEGFYVPCWNSFWAGCWKCFRFSEKGACGNILRLFGTHVPMEPKKRLLMVMKAWHEAGVGCYGKRKKA